MAAVTFENLDIVFGRRSREALAMIDQHKSRDEILAATGAVLGAAGINLAIEEGADAGHPLITLEFLHAKHAEITGRISPNRISLA